MTGATAGDRHHVHRSDRAITDPEAIDALLAEGRFVTIGFAMADEPYVCTLSYGLDAVNRRLYFHAAPAGLKHTFIGANPDVCATVVIDRGYNAGACEHEFASVVLRGTMSVVEDAGERRWGMDVLLNHLEMPTDAEALAVKHRLDGDAVYGRMAVLRLDIASLTAKAGR